MTRGGEAERRRGGGEKEEGDGEEEEERAAHVVEEKAAHVLEGGARAGVEEERAVHEASLRKVVAHTCEDGDAMGQRVLEESRCVMSGGWAGRGARVGSGLVHECRWQAS